VVCSLHFVWGKEVLALFKYLCLDPPATRDEAVAQDGAQNSVSMEPIWDPSNQSEHA
jgi:hypothetical protein